MTERKFDLVVFGATGFTGQYTVDEVARVAEEENLKWAIAGRNMTKLQKVLSEASQRTGKNLEETAIIIAETSSDASLLEMAQQTKLVLNCVGPYRFYGDQVVRACIEGRAHHLDISGEPQYLEKMQLLYNSKAKENNVLVIGAVGFDSIPAEMGIEFTRRQFAGGQMTNIMSFFSSITGPDGAAVNTGTLESAIYGFLHAKELKPLRKSLFPEPMPKYDYRMPRRSVLSHSKEVNKWCLPFMGSDKSVVTRTQRDLLSTGRLDKPFEFVPYIAMNNLPTAIAMMFFGIIFVFLSSFSFGRSLLMKYPHVFSFGVFKKGGPSKKQIDGCAFSMVFHGLGYADAAKERADKKPDKIVVTRVSGPEAGYVTTPICMVQCALTVLKEQDKMYHKGGVITPGAAFCDTNLIDRLFKHNVKCEKISEEVKQ